MVYYYLFSINEVSNIYAGKTKEVIIDLKKDFLKDTVNNLISEINVKRTEKKEEMNRVVVDAETVLKSKVNYQNEQFEDTVTHYFNKESEYDFWTVLLWRKSEKKAVYDNQKLAGKTWDITMEAVKSELSSYRILCHGDKIAVFGVKKTEIDDLVKADMGDRIRKLDFGDKSYVWVNEILNYQGGKNYAIRKIHPNLPETEGMFLSTDMTDEKGNHPYKMELDGINKNGDIFFSYYFKEPGSVMVSQKLTYAKLYKDFNWVIAIGIYMNDVDSYVNKINSESKTSAARYILVLALTFVVIMLFSYSIILLIEKVKQRYFKSQLESEIDQDTLTKAVSRRRGTKDLSYAFNEFKSTGYNSGIMMFDIDHFKVINDTYGHSVGDMVLVEVVKTIYTVLRNSDRLIRWGGDEFVIIFSGLQKINARGYAQSIQALMSAMKIPVEGKEITPTLSIGFSYFKETDSEFKDALKRADQAMYKSKANGRNQISLDL